MKVCKQECSNMPNHRDTPMAFAAQSLLQRQYVHFSTLKCIEQCIW